MGSERKLKWQRKPIKVFLYVADTLNHAFYIHVLTPTCSHLHLGSPGSQAQIFEAQASRESTIPLNLQQAKQGGSGLRAGGLIESAAKTHSQFPNCLLNTASNEPCCPAVPRHLCLLSVQLSLLLTCLDCTPKPGFPGPPPGVASCYCGSTQERDKGMSALYPKYDFCNEYVSSGNSLL